MTNLAPDHRHIPIFAQIRSYIDRSRSKWLRLWILRHRSERIVVAETGIVLSDGRRAIGSGRDRGCWEGRFWVRGELWQVGAVEGDPARRRLRLRTHRSTRPTVTPLVFHDTPSGHCPDAFLTVRDSDPNDFPFPTATNHERTWSAIPFSSYSEHIHPYIVSFFAQSELRYTANTQLEQLHARYVGTGHADLTKQFSTNSSVLQHRQHPRFSDRDICFFFSEWLTHQHRDTYASIIGHPALWSYLAIAEGETLGRTKFEICEVSLQSTPKKNLSF